MSTVVHVILSGSDRGTPSGEQFMLTYSGKSLFQLCIERNASFADRTLIIGHNDYYKGAKDYFKLAGHRNYLNIIEEDYFTNLYSVAFAALSADADEVLLVTPSNYVIHNEVTYNESIAKIILYAEKDLIGVLSLNPDQAIDNMPFLKYDKDKIIAVEPCLNNKQAKALSKSKKHTSYSGVICTKAGVYLEELKTLAPEVFKVAQNIWKERIGQYVTVDTNVKAPLTTIEDALLIVSDKVKVIVKAASMLQA
jgi:mannose-1-phosphate guanylyltransferase